MATQGWVIFIFFTRIMVDCFLAETRRTSGTNKRSISEFLTNRHSLKEEEWKYAIKLLPTYLLASLPNIINTNPRPPFLRSARFALGKEVTVIGVEELGQDHGRSIWQSTKELLARCFAKCIDRNSSPVLQLLRLSPPPTANLLLEGLFFSRFYNSSKALAKRQGF